MKKQKSKPTHATHHEQLNRLRRIEGQIRGLQKLISSETYCIDILGQFKAVHAALRRVESDIMHRHIANCVSHAVQKGSQKEVDKKLEEIMDVVRATQK